ncbi:MAG: hypothetical protein LBT08_07590 [Synergistaceae bacterium]|jgi:ElaB/YqjD/DUF883 family membrane-anchored ribosome-binding protein|nr:hypothetical protein [Synergistaceae bacterium]
MDERSEDNTAAMSMEEIEREIRALRAALSELEADGRKSDMAGVKTAFEDGFSRITEALRPLAGEKVAGPVMDAVKRLETKVASHPLTCVAIAIASGFVLGRIIDIASGDKRCPRCDKEGWGRRGRD